MSLVPTKYLIYGGLVLLVLGGLFYLRWDAYNDGVEATVTKYEKLISEERVRLDIANQQAINEAQRVIANLQEMLRLRNAQVQDLQKAASDDPDANRPAIGLDSVWRLNRIH